MTGEKMCFMHIFMNAISLSESCTVKIIFEGASVQLPSVFETENNKLYIKAKEMGLIAGICYACSKQFDVYDKNVETGLPILKDMDGHAGIKPFIDDEYTVISI